MQGNVLNMFYYLAGAEPAKVGATLEPPMNETPALAEVRRGRRVVTSDFHAMDRPWRVLLPSVYRYLPKAFVEAFFDTGSLMLSSFVQFSKHKDEARSDPKEGKAVLRGTGDGLELWSATEAGKDAFVLCGSVRNSREVMTAFDGCDAAIEIFDVPAFALEVARHLPSFRGGTSGHCIYGGHHLARELAEGQIAALLEAKPADLAEMLRAVMDVAQMENLLLKEPGYAAQAEYRLLWFVDEPVRDSIIVSAPNARQFCRPVWGDEIT